MNTPEPYIDPPPEEEHEWCLNPDCDHCLLTPESWRCPGTDPEAVG